MAAKFIHQLLGAFLTILVLQPFVAGQGWNNLPLTYGFLANSSLPDGLDLGVVISIIDAAFQVWQVPVPTFRFTRASSGEDANIKIAFVPLYPFYGFGFLPPDGRLYLDNSLTSWSTESSPPGNEVDLFSGVLHEIGITLGLTNSNNPSAVMYPVLNPGSVKRVLTQEDVTRIQALYPATP